jgi:uncharacterized protein
MRRTEREISDRDVIDKIINLCPVCRLGLYDGLVPYVVPVNFFYSEGTVYFHSAGKGKKLECMESGGIVAVEWDIPGGVVTADEPCDYGFEYASVIAAGRPFFVVSPDEKARILTALTSRYIRTRRNTGLEAGIPPEAARGTTVVGIELDEITGKASGGDYLAALLAGARPEGGGSYH